jgi:uncharacterized membrane protein YhaH (DUF805 family)
VKRQDYFQTLILLLTVASILYFCFSAVSLLLINEIRVPEIIVNLLTFLSIAYFFYGFILLFSITIQRLRDASVSPYYAFLLFIPVVGPLMLLYFLVEPSKKN